MRLQEFSTLVLRLHVGTRQFAAAEFREWSLQLVKPVLQFDAALWGRCGSEAPVRVSFDDLHRHGRPELVAAAERLCAPDGAVAAALAGPPSVTAGLGPVLGALRAPHAASAEEPAESQPATYVLCTKVHDPRSPSFNWLAILRSDPAREFSEQDRLLKQALTPHLMAACLANQALCVAQNDGNRPERRQSWAVADRDGAIQELTPRFRSTLSSECPDWDGSQRPPRVVGPLLNRDGTRYIATQLLFESHQVHDLYFTKVREKKRSDVLSARERSVAELFCDGLTYREIATRLLISPATVRAHLRGIYSKLGVSSKIGLTAALS